MLFAPSSDATDSKITEARVGVHTDKTRVVLEGKNIPTPRLFTLPSPPRVVLDFPLIDFKAPLTGLHQPPGSLVDSMRQGRFDRDTIRMVLDVTRPVSVNMFTIQPTKNNDFRLVIDLKPAKESQVISKSPPMMRAPDKPEPLPPPKEDNVLTIVLDPGHGGVDPGALNRKKNVYEKNIVLQVAKKLRDKLKKMPNTRVILTRETDFFIPLVERVRIAQRAHADLFISLHADAHRNRKVRGGSVYVLSEKASDKEAARLAKDANEGDIIAGLHLENESKDVQNILIDLVQRETMNKSALMAKEVLYELDKVIRLRKKDVMFAGFKVLKAPEIPSILIELSYLSSPTDEKNLRSPQMQGKMAAAIARGVESFLLRRGE